MLFHGLSYTKDADVHMM